MLKFIKNEQYFKTLFTKINISFNFLAAEKRL
jgi:hypothetical protein